MNESPQESTRAARAITVSSRVVLIVGFGGLLLLMLAAFSMSKILRLESETTARYQEIATARVELKHLSARLVEAQENERRSISRELHDQVGQTLTGVRVESEVKMSMGWI